MIKSLILIPIPGKTDYTVREFLDYGNARDLLTMDEQETPYRSAHSIVQALVTRMNEARTAQFMATLWIVRGDKVHLVSLSTYNIAQALDALLETLV